MIVVPCGEFWIVTDASGRVLAQGRKGLCERVVAGLPLIGEQGSLWDAAADQSEKEAPNAHS